jgi:hypothetical protein
MGQRGVSNIETVFSGLPTCVGIYPRPYSKVVVIWRQDGDLFDQKGNV